MSLEKCLKIDSGEECEEKGLMYVPQIPVAVLLMVNIFPFHLNTLRNEALIGHMSTRNLHNCSAELQFEFAICNFKFFECKGVFTVIRMNFYHECMIKV